MGEVEPTPEPLTEGEELYLSFKEYAEGLTTEEINEAQKATQRRRYEDNMLEQILVQERISRG